MSELHLLQESSSCYAGWECPCGTVGSGPRWLFFSSFLKCCVALAKVGEFFYLTADEIHMQWCLWTHCHTPDYDTPAPVTLEVGIWQLEAVCMLRSLCNHSDSSISSGWLSRPQVPSPCGLAGRFPSESCLSPLHIAQCCTLLSAELWTVLEHWTPCLKLGITDNCEMVVSFGFFLDISFSSISFLREVK